MPSEENLLVLKMLQDGTISADQASELLQALTVAETRTTAPAAPTSLRLRPCRADGSRRPRFVAIGRDEEPCVARDGTRERCLRAGAGAYRGGAGACRGGSGEVDGGRRATGGGGDRGKSAALASGRGHVAGYARRAVGRRGAAKHRTGTYRGERAAAGTAHGAHGSVVGRGFRLESGAWSSRTRRRVSPPLSAPREATTILSAGGTLRVKNTLGAIEVQGADVPEARIAGVLKIWAADEPTAQALAEDISIVVEPGDGRADGTRSASRADSEGDSGLEGVSACAQGARVSLLSLTGDLIARGSGNRRGDRAGDTVRRCAGLRKIGGDVAVETASGDIVIEGVQGNVTASSASGDIQRDSRYGADDARASTQSGDVTLKRVGRRGGRH